MKKTLNRKNSATPAKPGGWGHRRPQQQDEATIHIIQGLNRLISTANRHGLGNAARLLYTVKEDLVYWAVSMNFHETLEERFINRHLYDNSPVYDNSPGDE